MKRTKQEAVLQYLQSGADLTEGQARSRFGVQNLSAVASSLRYKGFPVYANRKTFNNGHTATVYRIGTPTRAVIAAGYRALAA
jgi:hypothetical protein